MSRTAAIIARNVAIQEITAAIGKVSLTAESVEMIENAISLLADAGARDFAAILLATLDARLMALGQEQDIIRP